MDETKAVTTGLITGGAFGWVLSIAGVFCCPAIPVVAVTGLTVISMIGGAAAGEGMGTDKREKFIREELKKELTQNIVLGGDSENGTQNSILEKQEKRMRVLREGIINAFQSAYADTQTAFATRQAEALNMYNLEIVQRQAIAEKHTELRITQIEPLRKNIEKFNAIK